MRPAPFRTTISALATAALLGVAPAAAPAATPAATPAAIGAPAVSMKPAGPDGSTLTLFNGDVGDHDSVMLADGTTYFVWESNNHTIGSCVLPPGTAECLGGVRSIPALGLPDGIGLSAHSGTVQAVWVAQLPGVDHGPYTHELLSALFQPDGSLSAPAIETRLPDNSSLLSVTTAPNGEPWALVQPGAGQSGVLVYAGLRPVRQVATPFCRQCRDRVHRPGVRGDRHLRVRLDQQPDPRRTLRRQRLRRFCPGRRARNVGSFGLASSLDRSKVILVSSTAKATYESASLTWDGTKFAGLKGSGDTKCTPTNHDLVANVEGHFVDVSTSACGNTLTTRDVDGAAGMASFATGGTPHDPPEIATSGAGTAWVSWSVPGDAGALDKLLAAPVLLPVALETVHRSSRAGKVSFTRPATCLTRADVPISLKVRGKGKGAKKWRVASTRITLGAKLLKTKRLKATLPGGVVRSGAQTRLTATVVFRRGAQSKKVVVSGTVRGCRSSS